MSLVDYASSSDDDVPDLKEDQKDQPQLPSHNPSPPHPPPTQTLSLSLSLFALHFEKFLIYWWLFDPQGSFVFLISAILWTCRTKSGSSSNNQPEASQWKLPDASSLLNSPSVSPNLLDSSDHSSRVAAAMAQNASRKRDSNGLASSSSTLRSKVPRGNLPPSRNVPDTAGRMLLPPQISGRLVLNFTDLLTFSFHGRMLIE